MRIATMIAGRDDDYVSVYVFVLLREKCMNSYVYTSIYIESARRGDQGAPPWNIHKTSSLL